MQNIKSVRESGMVEFKGLMLIKDKCLATSSVL